MTINAILNPVTFAQHIFTGFVALGIVLGAIALFFATIATYNFVADDSDSGYAPTQSVDSDDNIIPNYGPDAFAAVNKHFAGSSQTLNETNRTVTALDNTAWGANAKAIVNAR